MAPLKPMLGDLELDQVQHLETEGDQLLVPHRVPALEGDFLQALGRRGARIALTGALSGATSRERLKELREKLRAAAPLPFVADIASATKIDRVLVEALEVRDLAGKPERFEIGIVVREYSPPPAEETETPAIDQEIQDEASGLNAEQVDDIARELGTLEVRVDLGGDDADYAGFAVRVEGETEDGQPHTVSSDRQTGGVYRFTDLPAGSYTVTLEMP